MLTNEQAALLVKYYTTVVLSEDQKDRLCCKYWQATNDERKEIARAYAHLFANDAAFVQKLLLYHDMARQQQQQQQRDAAAAAAGERDEDGSGASDVMSPVSTSSGAASVGGSGVNNNNNGSSSAFGADVQPLPRRLTHSERLLRTAIADQFPRLTGSGPFAISFGLVQSEAERREVIDLYASQFAHPDPPELQRLVTLPQSVSTRTRRRITGSCTWYIRCHNTGDMVCAVTVTAHHHQMHHFVEMPLFATAAGYKRNGFGRLLNAALAAWCVSAEFEFTMISADVQAIPFWQHLGYVLMSRSEKNRIAFYYEHECYKFKGAEPMIGYCRWEGAYAHGEGATPVPLSEQRVADVLKRMTRFVMVDQLELPHP